MKTLSLLLLCVPVFFFGAPKISAAAPGPEPKGHVLWQISEGLAEPESVLQDSKSKAIYISNVAGNATDKDGRGWITKADLSGKLIVPQWVSGLNAPKGLAVRHGKLYAADIDEIVEIDIKKGEILRRIPVAGAKLLNDVVIDTWGKIYVSDTLGGKIYQVDLKDGASVFAEGDDLESPNGLALSKGRLCVAAWGLTTDWTTKTPGRIYCINLKTKEKEKISEPLGNLDGLVAAGEGSWYVSDWVAGKIFRVSRSGKAKMVLMGFQGSADIAGVEKRGLLLIPRMKENRVTAYDLARKRPHGRKPKGL